MPETMPFCVESLKGLRAPMLLCDITVLFWVLFMLVAVAFEARFTDDCPVWFMSFFPPAGVFKLGIVLFMLATRAIKVFPITLWSSFAEPVVCALGFLS